MTQSAHDFKPGMEFYHPQYKYIFTLTISGHIYGCKRWFGIVNEAVNTYHKSDSEWEYESTLLREYVYLSDDKKVELL